MNISSFFESLLSSKGEISSKRFMGIISLMVSMLCIIYLTITEGGTRAVEELIEMTLMISTVLLGVSSVTSIWKRTGRFYVEPDDKPDNKDK